MTLSNNQHVSLHDALELVPIFDGKNVSLGEFKECYSEAKELLPNNLQFESNFVKLLRSKLICELRKTIQGYLFIKLPELIYQVNKIYLPNKTL